MLNGYGDLMRLTPDILKAYLYSAGGHVPDLREWMGDRDPKKMAQVGKAFAPMFSGGGNPLGIRTGLASHITTPSMGAGMGGPAYASQLLKGVR